MPFGVQRGWMRYALPRPEILQYPLATTVIDSVVLNSAGVAPDASGPFMLRRYLLAGTVLSKRADNTYEKYTGVADVATGEAFTLTFVGPPTGGTFALGLKGATTGQLAYPTSPAALIAAIGALPGVGGGTNVTIPAATIDSTGNQVYTVTIAATQGEVGIPTADASQLTSTTGNQDLVVRETVQETPAGTQNVAGILFDTMEFADSSELSDEPAAMLRRNASFKASAIIGFSTNQAAITAALTTCEFL